ncbi:FapA family protein [Bacillus altitudinis]|uniref:flagellar assembly protein A n=1 Tax=Bacillus altitudinis TaxID=293387 RepID=UPI00064C77AE|nr:FapA family protein [Bacillus altitudinis]KLV15228.1 hypothetical protein ABW03_18960 [Bacillus altitudinis]MCY7692158.1 FapA family protein [Bacillus altitudinis]
MQNIISKGKNIKEAISIGLELMDATKQEVNIEILQQETKGFMGILGKQAVVKLTRMTANNPQPELNVLDEFEKMIEDEQSPLPEFEKVSEEESSLLSELEIYRMRKLQMEELSGKVWVEDGKLKCKSSPNNFPMVTIGEGIQLMKDNQLVKDKTLIVSEAHNYDVKVEDEVRETRWSIKMDASKLKVELKVDPGYTLRRSIQDTAPEQHIELKVEEKKEIVNTLQYADIMMKLEELRVIHGFYQDEIIKATQTNTEGTFLIAEGIKAQPGKDGWVELIVNVDDIAEGPKETTGGRVDFRETKTLSSVERGQVVAIIHPPEPGKMGYTVTNEPLPAKQTHPITVRAGDGINVVDDKIVATSSGRPLLEKRGKLVRVAILPKLIHKGNVDLASGNIRFKGDVEIFGEVDERMVVKAEGDVTVHKTITNATITSAGAIVTYSNIISSEVSAGKNNLLVVELGDLLGILYRDTEQIISVIKQLTLSPGFKSSDFARGGLQPLIRILLEKKFKNFQVRAKNYVEMVRQNEHDLFDDDWKEVSLAITQLFLSITKEVISIDRIKDLTIKMKELYEQSQATVDSNTYIAIPNVLNSQLYCSGNIMIHGQGTVNSKIHSGGKLMISGNIRGGEAYGRLGVEVNEVGAESGRPTLISVPDDQTIIIKKAMEGTIIQLGTIKHIFNQTTDNVCARLDRDGMLILHY